MSISPKLANSTPQGPWAAQHDRVRLQPAILLELMARHGLRRQRYGVIGLDGDMFGELVGLLRTRNEVFWFSGRFDPPQLQFDFNGLWFDAPFRDWRF